MDKHKTSLPCLIFPIYSDATYSPIASIVTNAATLYVWGNDLSGTPQGAGGVGGLLAAARGPAASGHPLFPLLCSSLNSELKSKVGAFYPCYDANGNVTEYVSAEAALAARYEYDAFGNITAQSGPMAGDFRHRFSTKYYDPETGLSYYIGRYYDPVLGCWLSSDPIGEQGGLNLYGFCKNDPINKVDKLGLLLISPVNNSPRERNNELWASAFIMLDGDDKQMLAGAGGGRLIHGKRVTVTLKHCKTGELTKKTQVLSKSLSLSADAISPYRTTQPATNGKAYIYFNLISMKIDDCVQGTVEVLANWHLYPKVGAPPLEKGVKDELSGSLDASSTHGNILSSDGWPNVKKYNSFSSGWFNFTVRISCDGRWEPSAVATPLGATWLNRLPDPNDPEQDDRRGGVDYPWMIDF